MKRIIISTLIVLLCMSLTSCLSFLTSLEDNSAEASEVYTETISPESEPAAEESTPAEESEESSELGADKAHPYVLTVAELAEEINADIKAAKAKYNGKWIKITGEITDTTDGGVCYGYYLYGQRATTGYIGLKIICWCEDGPYSGSVLGDTQTFLGQVLEISTVNSTEIIDCERIK